MKKEVFQFRRFSISQDQCAMKVGTDGVLLGAWAHGGRRILDIGAGTGLLCMMMAQRYPQSLIDGIEVDGTAARQAQDNVRTMGSRLQISHVRLQDFTPRELYDCMVTNPPFFIGSMKNPDSRRALARQADSMPPADIFNFARKWLTDEGEISLVVPAESLESFTSSAYLSGFRMVRKAMIRTKTSKPFKRCLIAFSKHLSMPLEQSEHCLMNEDGSRSEWYQMLTNDFYIK